jgi:hypothetical protein
VLRARVLLAVALRDLASQLRGRRGWVLPVLTAVLLAPLAAVPWPERPERVEPIFVSGDVPQAVLELEAARPVRRGAVHFRDTEAGLEVVAFELPEEVRDALDGPTIAMPVEPVETEDLPFPGRTLLLALLASSLLTGAVSESVPGERGRNTLEALLTAAVSRSEVVVGKWLAWSTFGATSVTLAALVALLAGHVAPGWWLVALPTVPLGTVALGLFLIRRARDVVGGATVSLRVLPALLSILGLAAWFFGLAAPAWGALVPVGGALVAAGATWEGPLGPILAAAVTLLTSGLMLALTARDLERPQPASEGGGRRLDIMGAVWVVLTWWAALGAGIAWYPAGNQRLAEAMPISPGLMAGTLGLGMVLSIALARAREPFALVGLARPSPERPWSLLLAPVAGALLAPALVAPLLPLGSDGGFALLLARTTSGLVPPVEPGLTSVLVLLGLVVVQEAVFRGWLQRSLGPLPATVLFAITIAPGDPIRGLLLGGVLAALTRLAGGHLAPALLARASLIVVAALLPTLLAAWG